MSKWEMRLLIGVDAALFAVSIDFLWGAFSNNNEAQVLAYTFFCFVFVMQAIDTLLTYYHEKCKK